MKIAMLNGYQLSAGEREEMWRQSCRIAGDIDRHIGGGTWLPGLPPQLGERLDEFAADSGRSGVLLLRGLAVGDLPPTHTEGGEPTELRGHPTAGTLVLLAERLGRLVGYADEKGGALIHDVRPVPGEERRIENSGAVAFDFHTENVHHPLRPDFLGLLCLRRDHDGVAATRVASVREAVRQLDPATVDLLREPRFHSRYPSSFTRDGGPERAAGPHPVVFGPVDRPFMRFNSHHTRTDDPAGRRALEELVGALESVCQDIVLSPGDCVIIDNHVAAHGRSAFTPHYDGQDRWLRRFYSLCSSPRWTRDMSPRHRVLPVMTQMAGLW